MIQLMQLTKPKRVSQSNEASPYVAACAPQCKIMAASYILPTMQLSALLKFQRNASDFITLQLGKRRRIDFTSRDPQYLFCQG